MLLRRAHAAAAARAVILTGLVVLVHGCGDGSGLLAPDGSDLCSLPGELLHASLPPDAIPALTLPKMVESDDPAAGYLRDFDRVLGVVIGGEARAYPHNILWWHEIVNDQIGDQWISVTFCPLTGSGLAFDPIVGGTRLDLGVSGLLFANNLVMFDRVSGAVFGPQLAVDGKCATFRNSKLALLPVQEMSWSQWKKMHPDTKVVSGDTGFGRNYQRYPYGNYDQLGSSELIFPMRVDNSRPIKERVLAIRVADGGRGYPFGELAEGGSTVALNETVAGMPTVIFYQSAEGEVATAFDARVDGQTLTFEARNGAWTDLETGSTWSAGGEATAGPLAGTWLKPRADAYVLFWFAWKHFQPSGDTYLR